MLKKIVACLLFLLLAWPVGVQAQELAEEEIVEGRVIEILDSGEREVMEQVFPYQDLLIEVERGSLEGSQIEVSNEGGYGGLDLETSNYQEYQLGDQLRIYSFFDSQNERVFMIDGLVRRSALLLLAILFIVAVLVIAGKFGLMSLLGLGVSFLVIVKVLLPMIMAGQSPILASLLTLLLIIPGTFYLSHGFNAKTHSAVAATLVSLLITMLLANYFIQAAHLTGFASEEAGFISVMTAGQVDVLALLFAGVMIGALGVLDDISIGQASVVEQLREANPNLKAWPLFWQSMKVGRDHVSSMINTLILVYAGASLPLLLLFFDSNKGFIDVIELEIVAEEIVRTLVSSLGLILAVPLTSFLTVFVFKQSTELGQ